MSLVFSISEMIPAASLEFGWFARGDLHFAVPFVTGPKAATSDYQPAPDGFAGIGAPVEKIYPCLVPFLELEDGRTIAAADGTDEIKPSSDGKSVTSVWRRWSLSERTLEFLSIPGWFRK